MEKGPHLDRNVCCCADEQERESTLKRLNAAVKSPSLLSKLKNAFTDRKDDSNMLKALKKVTDLTSQAQELLQQADKTIDALHYKVGFTSSLGFALLCLCSMCKRLLSKSKGTCDFLASACF